MQQVLRTAGDARFRSRFGTCGSFCSLRGDGSQRPRCACEPGTRRQGPRRRARTPARPVRGRVRPPAPARGRPEARDRARCGRDGRRGRGGRARLQHDRVLPGARAAGEARARRGHERAAGRDRARGRAGHLGSRHRRDAAACPRCRSSATSDMDVLRTTRINKGFLGARGLSLERGLMDLNPDEVRIKQEMADACEQVFGIFDGTKWHRSALLAVRPGRASRRDHHRLERPRRRGRDLAGRGRQRGHRRSRAARATAAAAARPSARRAQRRAVRLVRR